MAAPCESDSSMCVSDALDNIEKKCSDDSSSSNINAKTVKKKREAGVVYLSSIPPGITVKKVREIFSRHGEIGRIFLQQGKKGSGKNSRHVLFTEGWVEFNDKRLAKSVAAFLNNTPVGGKRRSSYYHCLWNIKYLHRFKWVHLSERLSYEKAMHEQRMRTEIAQAKRETNFFIQAVERSQKTKKQNKAISLPARAGHSMISQRATDAEMRQRQLERKGGEKPDKPEGSSRQLLKSVFGGED